MPEVTLTQASDIVAMDRTTVFRWVEDGLLPARRFGLRRDILIEVADLRNFAVVNGYRFNEDLATSYAK